MILTILLLLAAYAIGRIQAGLNADEAFDEGFSSGYDACVDDVANERIVITKVEGINVE